MLTGRSVRPTALAFLTLHRALAILVALAFSLNVATAAPRPSAPPVDAYVLTMPDCAGPDANVSITMNPDYMDDYNGCPFDATVAGNGCTATVLIPSSTCVPSSGTVPMATLVVRNKFGQVHAIAEVRAVDGVVETALIEL